MLYCASCSGVELRVGEVIPEASDDLEQDVKYPVSSESCARLVQDLAE